MTPRRVIVAIAAVVASLGVFFAADTIDVWLVGSVSRCGLGPGYAVASTLALAAWLLLGKRPLAPAARPLTMRTFARWALMIAALELALGAVSTGCVDTKAQGYSAMMRSDLRNLVLVETQVHGDSGRYTVRPALPLSPGTTDLVINLTADGWTGSVGGRSLQTCAVYVGSTKLAPAVSPAEPRCTPPGFDTTDLLRALGLLVVGTVLAAVGTVARRSQAAC